MKNLHLLPTDKPSRLYKHNELGFKLLAPVQHEMGAYNGSNQHIYITSDEVIKEVNDIKDKWVISNIGLLAKAITEFEWHFKNSKKIILTTDQDLIKDGVQPIDDEFLEWFVKNPSCEEVKVEEVYPLTCCIQKEGKTKMNSGCMERNRCMNYKITIPQEEPKQDYSGVHLRHCYQGEYKDSCKYGEDDCPAKPQEEPKQETLEEAAKLYIGVPITRIIDDEERYYTSNIGEYDAFIQGAKWQAERMYSEGEVLDILFKHTEDMFKGTRLTLTEWFEQFKKKPIWDNKK